MPSDRPRILCISPLFVPRGNAEAVSGASLVLALLERGADVRVLYDEKIVTEPGAHRDGSSLWKPLAPLSEGIPTPGGAATIFHDLQYRFYGTSASWVHAVVKRARELHREKPFDIVYSRSLPRAAHVAGYACSKALGVPWAANINDPWDIRFILVREPGRLPFPHRVTSDYWLRKTLRLADLLTFPCPRLRDYTARIAGLAARGEIVPHAGHRIAGTPEAGVFEIVHAGTFGSAYARSADVVLGGLSEFLGSRPEARVSVRLTLVGAEEESYREPAEKLGLAGIVRGTGWVPYEESLRRASAATVCLLMEPDQKEGVCLSMKLVDYLAARRPIIALNPRVGTLADMTPDPGLLRVDPTDSHGLASAIGEFHDAWRSGRIGERAPSEKLARNYDAREVAGKFLALVEGIIGAPKCNPNRRG